MQNAAVQYDKEIKKHLGGYRGTWLPNEALKLGMYGTLSDGLFLALGNIEDFGFSIENTYGEPAHINFCSSGEVEVKHLAKADLDGGISNLGAGLEIKFKKIASVYFNVAHAVTRSIENLRSLQTKLVVLRDEKKWDLNYVVVTSIVESQSTTILISNGAEASILLHAKGDVPTVDVADASVELSVGKKSGIGVEFIGAKGFTPLFKLSQLRKPFFKDPILVTRTHGAVGIDDDIEDDEVESAGEFILEELQ